MAHISLKVKTPLTKRQMRQWLEFVTEHCPVTTIEENGKTVRMMMRKSSGTYTYAIPLRDHCGDAILATVRDKWPLGDISATEEREMISLGGWMVDEETHRGICQEIAKIRHQRLVDRKVSEGWRFAMEDNPKEKTSRMLRPWDDLPEGDRVVDDQLPKLVIDVVLKWMDGHEANQRDH